MFAIATLMLTSAVLSAQSVPSVDITEYGGVAGSVGIAAGQDGAVWFTERGPGKIGRISTSGSMSEFALSNSGAEPLNITAGPDGALWFSEIAGNKIGRITMEGVISEFSIPTANASPQGITTGPDGALWVAESAGSRIGRITTAGTITEFALLPGHDPNSITVGPDGALWFTEYFANKIGRITTAGSVTEFDVPTSAAGLGGITAGPDGALWFVEFDANKIGRITTAGVVTEYTVPTSQGRPLGLAIGPDGALWFTEYGANKLGRITTAGVISEFLLSGSTRPWFITVGPDGALWFAEDTKIGRAQLPKSRTGVLAHIAAGENFWTTVITLVNTSAVTVPITVALHNDDGSALSLPVTVTQQGGAQRLTASSVNVVARPNATVLISLGEQVGSTVGWAEVLSPGPVSAFAIFRAAPQDGQASEGTVLLQTQFPSTMTIPFEQTGGFVLGVAIVNLSNTAGTIAATVWDESGNQLGTAAIPIAANGHTSFALSTQIALTSGQRGIVRFQSLGTSGLAGLGLRFSPFSTFTSVPTLQ